MAFFFTSPPLRRVSQQHHHDGSIVVLPQPLLFHLNQPQNELQQECCWKKTIQLKMSLQHDPHDDNTSILQEQQEGDDSSHREKFHTNNNKEQIKEQEEQQISSIQAKTLQMEVEPVVDDTIIMGEDGIIDTNTSSSMDLNQILQKARKRQMILLPYKIQALFDQPILPLKFPRFLSSSSEEEASTTTTTTTTNTVVLTVKDMVLLAIAIKLGSIGFSIGYVIGKGTVNDLRQSKLPIPIIVTELWIVGLAVTLDVLWNNVIP